MQYLISKGANIETTNYWGDHIIHSAARVGLLPMVNYNEKAPLHYACERGHLQIVEYLISKGANVEAKDKDGKYAIHFACMKGHLPIVKYLISTDASVDPKEKWERTPLHLAALFGHTNVKHLVYNCANIYAKMFDGQTPYDLAKNNEIRNFLKKYHYWYEINQ